MELNHLLIKGLSTFESSLIGSHLKMCMRFRFFKRKIILLCMEMTSFIKTAARKSEFKMNLFMISHLLGCCAYLCSHVYKDLGQVKQKYFYLYKVCLQNTGFIAQYRFISHEAEGWVGYESVLSNKSCILQNKLHISNKTTWS